MSPFSAPFFWGTQKRGLLLPNRAADLWEGTQWCKGGTGKAEAGKLPDAGISMKQCPENERQKEAAYGIGRSACTSRDIWAGEAEEKKSAVRRSPQIRKWCSIRGAPAFCGGYCRRRDGHP